MAPPDLAASTRRATEPWQEQCPACRASRPCPHAVPISLDRLKEFTQCGYLLTGPDGQSLAYESWRNQMAAATSAVSLRVAPHGLRHLAASTRIEAVDRTWETLT